MTGPDALHALLRRFGVALLLCTLAACGRLSEDHVVTGAPATAAETQRDCVHDHRRERHRLLLPAPAGGWSGHPQAVVVMNALQGEVDIRHGARDRCGTLQDARTLDSRFRAGMGTVLVPAPGDTAPIEVEFDRPLLPLWRPIVQLGEPAPVQRQDTARFSIRVASVAVMIALMLSALLTFFSTRERAFLRYALLAAGAAAWLALLSGLWAYPRPWIPLGDSSIHVMVALGVALTGVTVHALVRQSWMRNRLPTLDRLSTRTVQVTLVLALAVGLLPDGVLSIASVVAEVGFYLLCVVFLVFALVRLFRGKRHSAATLCAVLPLVAVGLFEAFAPDLLARWKVEAMMLAGNWLALTSSMVLTLRLGSLRQQRDEMRRLAQTDALTGLPNRRAGLERLETARLEAFDAGASLAVVFIDIDHFKRINDRHGHEVGDRVLRHVARMLRGAFRDIDYVARVGGEEFLVILPGAGPGDAAQRTESLRRALHGSIDSLGVPALHISLSAGISELQQDDTDTARLLRRADKAMYAAKRAGRDRVHIEPGLPT
ncbi:GGDEF domain-containing protein [Luteimonas cellulosilyticus]|uniref:GGDEF domain-containing protein n=1 Tax=Luteimonas cellulosilyticus TaxID=2683586 RepID=UPI0013596843|nr:GGDEF domain-containing protein [Luteimonas cellulosilyticus]